MQKGRLLPERSELPHELLGGSFDRRALDLVGDRGFRRGFGVAEDVGPEVWLRSGDGTRFRPWDREDDRLRGGRILSLDPDLRAGVPAHPSVVEDEAGAGSERDDAAWLWHECSPFLWGKNRVC